MLPRIIPFLFMFCTSLFLYSQSTAQEKVYFEPKAASGGKQSDFIEYKGITVFETTPESKFDRYSRIIPTSKYFVVCDYSAKRILIFDKNGRFLKKLKNKMDLGRLEYNETEDRLEVVSPNKMYHLTPKDHAQIQEDFDNPKNQKYFRKYFIDFSDTVNFPVHKQQISGADILNPVQYINGMHLVNQITVDHNFSEEEDYELKIYRGDSLLKQYFPYKKKTDSRYIYDGGTVYIGSAAGNNTKWVTHPYDYTLYALQKDSLYKVYTIILPAEKAIPQDFFSRTFQNKTEKENYIRQNRKLVKQFYTWNLSGRYLELLLQGMWYDQQQYIYDTQAKAFYDIEKIVPDSLTFYLPLCKTHGFREGALNFVKIDAVEALKSFEDHKKDNVKYPPLLEAYLNTANAGSNPVLINFTYRN